MKLMGAIRNREFGLIAELFCSFLARELGIGFLTPFVVNVTSEFISALPKPDQDVFRRSVGLNFGSEAAPAGFSLVPPEPRVPIALRSTAADIFAFDVLIQNYDRKADNPNLLWDRNKILAIDHEGALKPILLSRGIPSFICLELDKFYDHVFYSAVSQKDAGFDRLASALERLSAGRIDELLGEIPIQWQIGEDLAKVRERLLWIVENREQVCTLIRDRLS